MVADRCFLFGGYLYHAWKSILAIFARPQQHTIEAGHHLCESNLTSQDWKNNWCRSWLAGSLWIIFMPFGCCLLHCCALCIFACENFRSGFQFFTPSPFFPLLFIYIFFLSISFSLPMFVGVWRVLVVEYSAQIVIYIEKILYWLYWVVFTKASLVQLLEYTLDRLGKLFF